MSPDLFVFYTCILPQHNPATSTSNSKLSSQCSSSCNPCQPHSPNHPAFHPELQWLARTIEIGFATRFLLKNSRFPAEKTAQYANNTLGPESIAWRQKGPSESWLCEDPNKFTKHHSIISSHWTSLRQKCQSSYLGLLLSIPCIEGFLKVHDPWLRSFLAFSRNLAFSSLSFLPAFLPL